MRIRPMLLIGFLIFLVSTHLYAFNLKKWRLAASMAPQPTSCVTSAFSYSGDIYWYNVSLKLTNNCQRDIDLQNSSVTFNTADALNTHFWGTFNTISYPDNPLLISSQPVGSGGYIASLALHIPEQPWSNSILHNGEFITLAWGTANASYDASSVKIYLGDAPVQIGQINLSNVTTKPSTVTNAYALVDIMMGSQKINTVQVPWQGQFAVSNLSPGAYQVQPQTITDSEGNTYQGTANPTSVTVTANNTVNSTVSYTKIAVQGAINVQVSPLPSVLVGYTLNPSIVLTRADTGASLTQFAPWNQVTTINKLDNNVTYTFSTPAINYAGHQCVGTFTPTNVASKTTSPNTTQLTYLCTPLTQDKVTLAISGLTSTTNSINVVFQPSDGSAPVTKNVAITNGQGNDFITLTDGVTYNVSSTVVPNLTALFNPQPLTVKANVIETIRYQQQSPGRLMAYLPGWKTPPSAASIASAGYTHVLVAFGVFSTTQPGQIISAFDTVTASYIASLKQLGIKVILSLGGASTGIANTTTDFHQALSLASSPTAFQQTFIQSIENLVSQYGFDGIDIDIEHGLNGSGSFSSPTGDIAVLANIINTFHQKHPDMLISLTPQVANVSPTSGFDATWGNYASLIMQTHQSLSWVGIQIYNTGCAYGIDLVCYADDANSPNLSVAMAAGLLENWPAKTKSGQNTGFQPYLSYLEPSQVVLGYPAPNKSGVSDGSSTKPTAIIKRAIQCLRNGTVGATGCDSYLPPRIYSNLGGVFEWEITYDQDNNFAFATNLKNCVLNNSC